MSNIWKTIPLFISSTFRDMHAERDELNNVVFPAIAERLKARRCRLEPIDLRVGVETDSTKTERERELQILKVCLAEIDHSRPFLLVLLGDRYGWVPGSDRIKAASDEAGFAPEDNDASVTALEIEYGLLKKNPAQRRRCLLCLREPLPYDRMPQQKAAVYSDTFASDPGAPDRVRRLQKLKDKINNDPELADHCLPYKLDWDENLQQPKIGSENNIHAWGRKVEAALWALLDDETKQFAAQAEPTWQEQESFAIEELVERLNGSFVGREKIVTQAINLAVSAQTENTTWGLCFAGESGTGKSALFAHIHHNLSQRRDVLLLAHAAGVSPKSSQTEWMLRRWVSELGTALGETPAIPKDIKPEALERLFAQMLTRVAASRRVVVLVDALNQFLRTERSRTVSWLPVLWPANARFITTAIPGEETSHLAHRPGFSLVNVPALDTSESNAIAAQVYGRYHRQPSNDVLRELFSLRLPDGTTAAGNPLWLNIALDLINQFDIDDFSDVEVAAGGSPDEKLRAMILERARTLPPDVAGLYGRLLARVEKVASIAETRAFAALIALSRHGWREEDLKHLLPKAADLFDASVAQSASRASHSWDALRFAILRRSFHAHLVKRGELEQWDFAHTTLRQAILSRLTAEWQTGRANNLICILYSYGADYLEALAPGTGVRENETMWQMLGTRDALRVARYYAITTSESKMLALFLSEDETENSNHPLRQFVLSLLDVGGNKLQAVVANKFNSALNDALGIEGHLFLRKELLEATQHSLACLTEIDPSNVDWQHGLSNNCVRISDVLRAQGDLSGALKALRNSLVILQRLTEADPSSTDWQYNLSVSHVHIGNALRAQGDLAGALKAFRNSLIILQRLTEIDPSNTDWQHGLYISHDCIGLVFRAQGDLAGALKVFRDVLVITQRLAEADPSNTDWQHDLAASHDHIGDALKAQGDLSGALKAFRNSLVILQRLAETDPSNANWQRNLSVSHVRIGDALKAQGDLSGALKVFRNSLVILQRLAEADPSNAGWQYDLSASQDRIGDVFNDQGDLAGALKALKDSFTIRKRLAEADPSNTDWQCYLSISHDCIGDVLKAQGDLAGGLNAFRDSLAIRRRLVEADPSNTDWQYDLSASQDRIGDVFNDQGDLAGALKSYKDSLAIRERLVKTDPSNTGWQRELFVSFTKIGDVLNAQSNLAGALNAYKNSLVFFQRLAESDPTDTGWQHDLSLNFFKIGDVFKAQGDLAGALKSYKDSLAIRERLVKTDPSNTDWQYNLSASFIKIGDVLRAQGDLAGALKSYRDSLAISQHLTEAGPSSTNWQNDLSVSQGKIGDVLIAQGDLAGALKSYKDSLAIAQRLAEADPSDTNWQCNLSVSQETLGDVLSAQGDLAGALKSYKDSLAIRENLAKTDPSNANWQRNLSVSFIKIGDVLSAQGDLASAFTVFRFSLDITKRLADADPSNTDWQSELFVSFTKIGDVLNAQSNLAGALTVFRASLAIAQRLAEGDPSNTGWQRDLSISQEKLGDVLSAQGDLAGALNAYGSSLTITKRLADADPSNTGWQRDIFVGSIKIGDALSDQGDLAGALEAYRASLVVAQRLAEADSSNAVWQRDVWGSYCNIAEISERIGNADALDWLRKAFDKFSEMKQRGIIYPGDEKYLEQIRQKLEGKIN
ncbi:MAG: tetratricopeptide repeat protein [Candidatus Omnitrophica bacterium]|nr:tetratricopeptide repeat protein [Candidatus Omnitrophota bacterium]